MEQLMPEIEGEIWKKKVNPAKDSYTNIFLLFPCLVILLLSPDTVQNITQVVFFKEIQKFKKLS